MMIMSHRGFWRNESEKNKSVSFQRTIAAGYGTETDVRDLLGRLVVSHDPAQGEELCWSVVVSMFDEKDLPLAVNIKADGLTDLLTKAFEGSRIPWFAFDMSGPETVRYAAAGLPFYTRHSDLEHEPILYAEAKGVWLDDFHGHWFSKDIILRHVDAGKSVCIVSPELHGREPRYLWDKLAESELDIMICTDYPDEANRVLRR